jgi:hypothetical protein
MDVGETEKCSILKAGNWQLSEHIKGRIKALEIIYKTLIYKNFI